MGGMGMVVGGIIGGSLSASQSEISDKQRIEEYRTQRNIANYNAQVSRVQAEDERRRSRFEAVQLKKGQEYDLGMMEAIIGSSGGDAAVGSNLEAVGEQVAQYGYDISLLFFDSEARAQQLESQAGLDEMQARQFNEAAEQLDKMKLVNSMAAFFGGGGGAAFSNILSGGGQKIQPQQTDYTKYKRKTLINRPSPKYASGGYTSFGR